jgi:hypothetical protein
VPILRNKPVPEFIFDVLETPLRDLSGDIIYEENSAAISSRRGVIHRNSGATNMKPFA